MFKVYARIIVSNSQRYVKILVRFLVRGLVMPLLTLSGIL